MTTLKSINKSIEEGNADLEKLNKKFTKWFELQKRNRLDDLEDRREARRAMKGGAGAAVAATGTNAEKPGFKIPKLLTGISALLAALAAFKAFGPDFDPGDSRPPVPKLQAGKNLRTVRTGAAARQIAKIKALNTIRVANLAAELAAEKLKAQRLAAQLKADAKAKTAMNKYSNSRTLAVETQNIKQIKADAARFRANSNKPTTNFKPFTPGYKPEIMFPNAQTATVQGNLTRMSRPATVMSNSGKIYPVDSPEGRRVIKMTQTYQDSVKNMRGNGQMTQKSIRPYVSPYSITSSGKSKSQFNNKFPKIDKFTGLGTGRTSNVQVLRAKLLSSGAIIGNTANNFNSSVKGFSGKIMNMYSATGNWIQDKKDLMAYRQGAALPKWAKWCLRFAGWLAKKAVWAYVAYQWYYVMTDTSTSMQYKIVTSAGLLGSILGFTMGAAVGAFLGTLAIPVPIVGSLIGGAIGGYLAGKDGYFIGEYIARRFMGIPQPERVVNDIQEYKDRLRAATAGHHGNMAMGLGETSSIPAMAAYAFGFGSVSSGTNRSAGVAVRHRDLDNAAVRAGRNIGAGSPDLIGGLGRNLEGRPNMTGIQYTEMRNRRISEAKLNALKSASSGTTTFDLMADALRNQSGGGGFFNQSNNANDNSTTHHHNYGNNQIRTVDTLMNMNGHSGYGVMGLQTTTAMGGFSSP